MTTTIKMGMPLKVNYFLDWIWPEMGRDDRPWVLWLRVGLWCGVIFMMSGMPSHGQANFETLMGWAHFLSRKCAHVTEYCVLFLFTLRAAQRTWPQSRRRHFLPVFFFTLFY